MLSLREPHTTSAHPRTITELKPSPRTMHYYECLTCDDTFWYEEECNHHMDEYGHWPECETCSRTFGSWHACHQHMNSTQHWAPRFGCETCSKSFLSRNAATQHMNSTGHWKPRIECDTCLEKFYTQQDANQHMKVKGHYRNYCQDCDRHFMNENNLRMHLNSKLHRGLTLPCPFCNTKYTAASGLVHHLERGACPQAPGLNRERILELVRQRDPHGTITNKQIEWREEQKVEYSATDRAFNGQYWECYLCHRTFWAMTDLNKHLNSSTHKSKVYHCPNSKCGKQFATLASLFNHLESESCAFMRFSNVQNQVQGIITGGRSITFHS